MRSDLIKQGVVPHVTQIAIGLDADERRVLEGRGTELVSLAEFLRIEICDVSREEHLDDVKNRRLSGSWIAIDDEHLLDALNIITVDQGADAPFELFTFGWGIQRIHEPVVCRGVSLGYRVFQLHGGVVLALRSVIGEYDPLIENRITVGQIAQSGNISVPATVGGVLHKHAGHFITVRRLIRVSELLNITIDQLAKALKVLRPEMTIRIEHRIKRSAFDEQIVIPSHLRIGEYGFMALGCLFDTHLHLIHLRLLYMSGICCSLSQYCICHHHSDGRISLSS